MQADARARSCSNNVWCSTEVASHLCLQSYGVLRWRMRSTLTFASVYIKQMVKIPLINRIEIKTFKRNSRISSGSYNHECLYEKCSCPKPEKYSCNIDINGHDLTTHDLLTNTHKPLYNEPPQGRFNISELQGQQRVH